MSAARVLLEDEIGITPIEQPRGFAVVPFLQGEAPEPPTMDVQRWLLSGEMNLLSSKGGDGKGVLEMATALSTAVGLALFGTLQVNRVGPVLMHVPEDGAAVARMRLDALIRGCGFNPTDEQIARERILMIEETETVDITTSARRLGQTIRETEAVLSIFDPIGNMLGGKSDNENAVADWVMASLRREICRAYGTTVLLAHHIRKPGKDDNGSDGPSQHDTRGGGGWTNGSRLVHAITKKGTRITTTVTKANGIMLGLKHELDLHVTTAPDNEAHWVECRIQDANAGAISQSLTPGVGRPINENERRALLAVDNQLEPGRRVSWSEWVKTSGLNEETLKTIKTRMLKAHLVDAFEAGQHRNGGKLYAYAINDRGRNTVKNGWVDEQRVGG